MKTPSCLLLAGILCALHSFPRFSVAAEEGWSEVGSGPQQTWDERPPSQAGREAGRIAEEALKKLDGRAVLISPKQETRPPSPGRAAPSAAELDRWIDRLGDPDFGARERAEGALRELGGAACEALGRREKDGDAEIRDRVERLLESARHIRAMEKIRMEIICQGDGKTLRDVVLKIWNDGDKHVVLSGDVALEVRETGDSSLLWKATLQKPFEEVLPKQSLEYDLGLSVFGGNAYDAKLLSALAEGRSCTMRASYGFSHGGRTPAQEIKRLHDDRRIVTQDEAANIERYWEAALEGEKSVEVEVRVALPANKP
mgnify:CR=1 FL=1